jgi:hypothetical protein
VRRAVLALAIGTTLTLSACGTGPDEGGAPESGSDNGENAGSGESADSGDSTGGDEPAPSGEGPKGEPIFEMGETVQVEVASDPADGTYEATIDSARFTDTFEGTHISEYVINAPESAGLLVVSLTITNTGSEPHVLLDGFQPTWTEEPNKGMEYAFELDGDQGLTATLEPGQEREIELAYSQPAHPAEEGLEESFVNFEPIFGDQPIVRIPSDAIESEG